MRTDRLRLLFVFNLNTVNVLARLYYFTESRISHGVGTEFGKILCIRKVVYVG